MSPSDPLAEVLAGTADRALPQVLSDAITDADEEEFNSSGCGTRSAYRAWRVEYCGWSESRRDRYYAECERWKRNGSTHFEDNCCNRPAPTCAGIYVYDEKDFMDEDFQYEDFQGEDFQDLFQGEDFQDEEFHDEDVQEDFDEFQFE